MQWSKLKTRIKALICPESQNRIDFHVTRYREATDFGTEAWITVDGIKVFGGGHYHRFVPECQEWHRRVSGANSLPYFRPELKAIGQEIAEALNKQEIHDTEQIVGAMRKYLDLSIEEALQSDNPFIKALAVIDRRTGKRTIEKLQLQETDHSLVRRFYELRVACMHIY
jgi:hypothetical protein